MPGPLKKHFKPWKACLLHPTATQAFGLMCFASCPSFPSLHVPYKNPAPPFKFKYPTPVQLPNPFGANVSKPVVSTFEKSVNDMYSITKILLEVALSAPSWAHQHPKSKKLKDPTPNTAKSYMKKEKHAQVQSQKFQNQNDSGTATRPDSFDLCPSGSRQRPPWWQCGFVSAVLAVAARFAASCAAVAGAGKRSPPKTKKQPQVMASTAFLKFKEASFPGGSLIPGCFCSLSRSLSLYVSLAAAICQG